MTRISTALSITTLFAVAGYTAAQSAPEERVQLTVTGGHDTDPRDHGRPVTLVAHALGVPDDVFREAFSHVRPAPPGTQPDPAEVQRNKSALLGALAKYGVSNQKLDRVSDYYRYRPAADRLWAVTPAAAYIIVQNGAAASIVITDAGSGYSSPPRISAPGHPEIALEARLAFGQDLKKNGSLAAIVKR